MRSTIAKRHSSRSSATTVEDELTRDSPLEQPHRTRDRIIWHQRRCPASIEGDPVYTALVLRSRCNLERKKRRSKSYHSSVVFPSFLFHSGFDLSLRARCFAHVKATYRRWFGLIGGSLNRERPMKPTSMIFRRISSKVLKPGECSRTSVPSSVLVVRFSRRNHR